MRAFSGRAKNHKCTKRSGGMMATATFDHRESRLDRYFFPGLALLVLATVFWGFARSYFLAGVFKAPLPNWLIHLHGAAFTSWILLLIAQTTLVSAHRVDVHRELDPKTFYIIPLTDMLIFGTLVLLAFRTRSNPPAHKRLILVATTALMLAAVARWPIPFIQHHPLWVAELFTYGFLALLLAYDVYSTGKMHRVTIWASAFLIAVQRVRVPLGETAAWQGFDTWAQNLARTIHG